MRTYQALSSDMSYASKQKAAGKQIYYLIVHSDSQRKDSSKMDLRSMLQMEHRGMLFFTLFYAVAGILNLLVLAIHGIGQFHVALVAVLSLITAYGLFTQQGWSLWTVVALFFIGTTYGGFTITAYLSRYGLNSGLSDLLTILALASYLILTWAATLYVVARRRKLM